MYLLTPNVHLVEGRYSASLQPRFCSEKGLLANKKVVRDLAKEKKNVWPTSDKKKNICIESCNIHIRSLRLPVARYVAVVSSP